MIDGQGYLKKDGSIGYYRLNIEYAHIERPKYRYIYIGSYANRNKTPIKKR